jgi:hypothetical protein
VSIGGCLSTPAACEASRRSGLVLTWFENSPNGPDITSEAAGADSRGVKASSVCWSSQANARALTRLLDEHNRFQYGKVTGGLRDCSARSPASNGEVAI